jgi:hypothetical protein
MRERLQARCFRLEPGIPVLRLGERSGTVILLVTSTLGNCSCVALDGCSRRRSTSPIHGVVPPASMQSSATAPALRSTRMCKCRGRRMRWSDLSTACSRRGSTASIHGVVPPASMQSSATAPALRSTWMCKCRGRRMRWSDPRRLFQTPFYLPRPWGRTSCIHAVVGNCSCVALPPASMQSSATAPALLYLLHPCSRPSSRGIHAGCSLASRRASVFLLRGHCAAGAARTAQLARRAKGRSPKSEKGTKEKATPKRRSPGSCPPTPRQGSGGSLTAPPCAGSKLGAIPRAHPTGLSCALPPPLTGPL